MRHLTTQDFFAINALQGIIWSGLEFIRGGDYQMDTRSIGFVGLFFWIIIALYNYIKPSKV